MTIRSNPSAAALMGALVGDAATLGLHWIYDPERIAQVGGDNPAFVPIDQANYEGVRAFFAHGARKNGDLSQYGETLSLALNILSSKGEFDVESYQDAYLAHFGAGGSYQGYIDRPTRGTVDNILADKRHPSGIDDDQHPAIATLPALVARYHKTPDFHAKVTEAVQVTNVNKDADHYSTIFVDLLGDVLSGTALDQALVAAAKRDPLLQAALDTDETDSTAYGEITGRPCHLSQGMPLAFHVLSNTDSYQSAIEANIRAGGDSCGRAIMIGSLAGASYGLTAIPLEWMFALNSSAQNWTDIKKVLNS